MRTQIDITILENRPLLKRIAAKFTSDPYEKDELVQETFMRSFSSLHKFVDHPKLISWLYVIMKNIYINKYKRASIRREAEKEIIHTQAMASEQHNQADSKFALEDIDNAFKNLSEENYSIISMYLEGYSYREIAVYHEIKEGTIKTRIHTIRKSLKKELHAYN